ncbi:hypothetical protein EXE41_16195, partial [Halorubrum sp. SD690R]
LARTVRLSVDRANIDTQRLCPDCFADWIQRYQDRLGSGDDGGPEGGAVEEFTRSGTPGRRRRRGRGR